MNKYKYIGGMHKVSITIESYNSFQYPCEQFRPVKFPLYSIGYDKLGKRKQVKTRSKKQLIKIFKDLKVNPLSVNEFCSL
jgi:hypothetical protein